MCVGIPLFADNKKALYGKKTNSHSTAAEMLKINEDQYRKYEYHWFDKKIVDEHYDDEAEKILTHIDKSKSDKLVRALIRKQFQTQKQLASWLRGIPDEWGHLMEPRFYKLAKMVNPKLVIYQKKIACFKKQNIEKYNPYQATKLPKLSDIKKKLKGNMTQVRDQVWAQVRDQVRDHVWAQVWAQVWDQVWDQVGDQVGDQVRDQVGDQVRDQVRDHVWDQVGDQVRDQVRDQVVDQVGATSYWGIKVALSLPIKHWFFDWLKLGIMVVFVQGKCKVFGKKGKYLGEYDEKEVLN